MKWYLLPAMYQRHVCSIILMNQNGAVLTIGPFGSVNFETATDVRKYLQLYISSKSNYNLVLAI